MRNDVTSQIFSRHSVIVNLVLMMAMLGVGTAVRGDDATTAERDFTLRILPLLKQKCLGCHGGDPSDIKGEYSVVDRAHLLAGGESGDAAVIPRRRTKAVCYQQSVGKGWRCLPKKMIV